MSTHSKLPYYPSLDGLRALSIIAVILYHADSLWLAGGFLGVEAFFAISGFIITTLLLHDRQAGLALDLRRFWRHRCRRLLPGMLTTVLVTAWVVAVRYPEEWGQIQEDLLPSLTFTSNWFYIANERPYFDLAGRPRLYEHLWSLAVEFQYYLLWPVICLALFRCSRTFSIVFCLAGAFAASAWMALGHVPDADPTRWYFGTDTRLSGLLIGSATAFSMPRARGLTSIGQTCCADIAAGMALLGLLAFFVLMDEMHPVLYQGGFAAVALLTSLCIWLSIVHHNGLIAAILGAKPLTTLGLRAYNVYLWHWPVFCLTQPWVDVPLDGAALFAFRLGIIALLAEISYRWIDTPIRRGWLQRRWQKIRQRQQFGAALASSGIIAVAVIAMLFTEPGIFREASARSIAAEQAELLGINAQAITAGNIPAPTPAAVEPSAAPPPISPTLPWIFTPGFELAAYADSDVWQEYGAAPVTPPDVPAGQAMPMLDGTPPALPASPNMENTGQEDNDAACRLADATAHPPNPALNFKVKTRDTENGPYIVRIYPAAEDKRQVFAIGDSIMLGAANQLWRMIGDIDVDAQVGRQLSAGTALLAERKRRDLLADTVIVHLGNNSPINARQLSELLEVLKDTPQVVLVNLKVPRPYESANNALLTEAGIHYPNVTLIDWHGPSLTEKKVFARDGMHLTGAGVRLYTRLISQTLCNKPAAAG